ncbi:MAG TPA: ribosome maturation factor RimM [Nitrospiria bacterium]|nr:ribosome maturation factor RimM [Nitrospiria bacterium]
MEQEWIVIGRILKPRGLKGELKVHLLTDFPERFSPGKIVVLKEDPPVPYRIEESAIQGETAFIKLEGIATVDVAEALAGKEFIIPIDELAPLEKGVYYPFQLIGFNAYTEEGKFIGVLTEIYPGGAHDLYEIREGKKEFLVPGTREFIREINLPERKIVIHAREGLLGD